MGKGTGQGGSRLTVMTLGARLRQRLDALSSGRLKLAALAALLVYAITIFCSVVVQVTMTIAAVAKDPVIVAAAELWRGRSWSAA